MLTESATEMYIVSATSPNGTQYAFAVMPVPEEFVPSSGKTYFFPPDDTMTVGPGFWPALMAAVTGTFGSGDSALTLADTTVTQIAQVTNDVTPAPPATDTGTTTTSSGTSGTATDTGAASGTAATTPPAGSAPAS